MNAQEVQAWVNRQPALLGSVEYRRIALTLGQALDRLQARLATAVAEAPATPAAVPAIPPALIPPHNEESQTDREPVIDLNRANRRGPYRRRNSHPREITRPQMKRKSLQRPVTRSRRRVTKASVTQH